MGVAILVVDDDEVFREALADNLRVDGHVVEGCASTLQALEAMGKRAFSLMITDYLMPDGTGIELADQFHGLRGDPSVIVTAYPSPILHSHASARTHVHLLQKPVDYADLHELAHRVLGPGG
jgi:DNA-binding NtrC family response regulator